MTVSEVSQSKRTESWVSVTYMKIWVQRQVLVVSILEKKRQKLELHWQPPDSVRYQAREIRQRVTKEDGVHLWPPTAHTHTHVLTLERVQTLVHTHTMLQHMLNKIRICQFVPAGLQLQLLFTTVIYADSFAKFMLVRFTGFCFCTHYTFLYLPLLREMLFLSLSCTETRLG